MGRESAVQNQNLALPRADASMARRLTPLQALYLDRLRHLVHKVHLHGRYLATTDRRMQFLNRAVLATLCSCRDEGVEGEARAILVELRRGAMLHQPGQELLPGSTERQAAGRQAS
jgi:hypothetical protein